jgi:hypothetical protein
VSIVNGTWHRDGTAPPFDPHRIAAALLVLQNRPADDDELVAVVGAPVTPTGSVVTGEVDAVLRGRTRRLRLTASFAHASRDDKAILRVTNFPLPRTATAAGDALNQGMRDEHDLSRSEGLIDFQQRNDTLFCFVKPTEQAEVIAARLRSHPAFFVDVDARLPAPMPQLLRNWTTTYGGVSARETLEKLAS